MSSTPKNCRVSLRTQKRKRRTGTNSRRRAHACGCRAQRSIGNGGSSCSKVSDKLEALKNLISPAHNGGEAVKADQLFQETADYIVHLRTQVLVLQSLIEFYGSSSERDKNDYNVVL